MSFKIALFFKGIIFCKQGHVNDNALLGCNDQIPPSKSTIFYSYELCSMVYSPFFKTMKPCWGPPKALRCQPPYYQSQLVGESDNIISWSPSYIKSITCIFNYLPKVECHTCKAICRQITSCGSLVNNSVSPQGFTIKMIFWLPTYLTITKCLRNENFLS